MDEIVLKILENLTRISRKIIDLKKENKLLIEENANLKKGKKILRNRLKKIVLEKKLEEVVIKNKKEIQYYKAFDELKESDIKCTYKQFQYLKDRLKTAAGI